MTFLHPFARVRDLVLAFALRWSWLLLAGILITALAGRRAGLVDGVRHREQGSQPVVQDAVDHEMDAVGFAEVVDAVRQVEVDEPAFAFGHLDATAFEGELDAGVRGDRDVEPDLSVFEAEKMVAVFADSRARAELQKPD